MIGAMRPTDPSGVPGGSDTIVISNAAVNSTVQILLSATHNPADEGSYTTFSLTNGAIFQTSSAFRLRSVQDTTRNMFIGAGSSFITTGAGNAFQIGSNHSKITTVTVQGTLQTGNMIGEQLPTPTFEGSPGGYIFDVDGGSLSFTSTNFHFQGARHNESIGQFRISNGGFVSLGTITDRKIENSSNFYIDFVDGTGSLEFSSTGYSTLAAVEGLIDGGQIRFGGSIVDSSFFSINSLDDSWQIGVIPEPSTYALMAGLVMLAGAALFKRRP